MINNKQKTQQAIQNDYQQHRMKEVSGALGVIIDYDELNNTATVAVTGQQSDEIQQILTKVMCPVTLGVQSVAPIAGMQCWIIYKDGNITQPLISHYYNHRYSKFDYPKQTKARDMLPGYLMSI